MKKLPLFQLILSMAIFGTIGLCVRYIPAERGMIAFIRGALGALFMLIWMLATKKKPSFTALRKNLWLLLLSGAAIGANWILLFESYGYTTVATATLCYYMAPVFVILFSPLLLKERIPPQKWIAVGAALCGMVLVSGIMETRAFTPKDLIGVFLALGAAVLYASVTFLNKKMRAIPSEDMTLYQLTLAATVVLPYTLLAEDHSAFSFDVLPIALLVTIGLLHTGVAYAFFFSAMKNLPAQTVAIFSYLDPIVAVVLSFTVLQEPFSPLVCVGAVLIVGALLFAEMPLGKKKNRH